jgi:hypothetical protein
MAPKEDEAADWGSLLRPEYHVVLDWCFTSAEAGSADEARQMEFGVFCYGFYD